MGVQDSLEAIERCTSPPRALIALFATAPDLSVHAQDIIKRRIEPYANRAIVGYLGAEEPELVNVITEYLRAHKTPQELLEELEPVRH